MSNDSLVPVLGIIGIIGLVFLLVNAGILSIAGQQTLSGVQGQTVPFPYTTSFCGNQTGGILVTDIVGANAQVLYNSVTSRAYSPSLITTPVNTTSATGINGQTLINGQVACDATCNAGACLQLSNATITIPQNLAPGSYTLHIGGVTPQLATATQLYTDTGTGLFETGPGQGQVREPTNYTLNVQQAIGTQPILNNASLSPAPTLASSSSAGINPLAIVAAFIVVLGGAFIFFRRN